MTKFSTAETRELSRLAKLLAKTKFRISSQGDLLTLQAVSLLNADASASNLILGLTISQGRMLTLSQIAPMLKTLTKQNLVIVAEKKSDQTGRPVATYALTKKGREILDLGIKIVETMARK